MALVTRLRAGLLAGHQIVLQRVTGPGTVFVTAAGDFVSFTLAAGETFTTLRALSESFLTGPWGCTGGGRVFDDTAELNRLAAAAARHVVWLGRVK